jgi:hypothetical protein
MVLKMISNYKFKNYNKNKTNPGTWNIDSTVTGSVADIRAPNIRHSTSGSLYIRNVSPPR